MQNSTGQKSSDRRCASRAHLRYIKIWYDDGSSVELCECQYHAFEKHYCHDRVEEVLFYFDDVWEPSVIMRIGARTAPGNLSLNEWLEGWS